MGRGGVGRAWVEFVCTSAALYFLMVLAVMSTDHLG